MRNTLRGCFFVSISQVEYKYNIVYFLFSQSLDHHKEGMSFYVVCKHKKTTSNGWLF